MKRINANRLDERSPGIVAREEILQQAKRQQGNLATRFEDLLGDGGPPDETADEMIRAIREWRDTESKKELKSSS